MIDIPSRQTARNALMSLLKSGKIGESERAAPAIPSVILRLAMPNASLPRNTLSRMWGDAYADRAEPLEEVRAGISSWKRRVSLRPVLVFHRFGQ